MLSRWIGLNGDGLSNMNKITELDYKICLKDFINCLNDKYKSMTLMLDISKYGLSIVFKYNDSECDINYDTPSYFHLSKKTFNCKTYRCLFKNFIDSIHIFLPDAEKLFGKTFYEIRLNCDLMMT